ncbi:ATP-binding protein [Streptomyces sp. NPDC058255]|uniref:ATP-binding protein n=1 Tax=Streptomyces sp. NPDC058255 TaxID=3346407 RepID=UPI0036E32811
MATPIRVRVPSPGCAPSAIQPGGSCGNQPTRRADASQPRLPDTQRSFSDDVARRPPGWSAASWCGPAGRDRHRPYVVAIQATRIVAIAPGFLACRTQRSVAASQEMIALDSTLVETVSERVEIWIEGGHYALSQARTACCRLAGNAAWPPEAQGDLTLVVSELVTNACRHSSGPCRMSLEVSADAAVVEVWDSDPHIPTLPVPSSAPVSISDAAPACSGYGLGIVASLSKCLDFLPQDIGGKTARAVVVP